MTGGRLLARFNFSHTYIRDITTQFPLFEESRRSYHLLARAHRHPSTVQMTLMPRSPPSMGINIRIIPVMSQVCLPRNFLGNCVGKRELRNWVGRNSPINHDTTEKFLPILGLAPPFLNHIHSLLRTLGPWLHLRSLTGLESYNDLRLFHTLAAKI